MTDERLLATCWTTAGAANPLPGDQRSPIPIREGVEAPAGHCRMARPVGVEILSDGHRETPVRQAVANAYRTAWTLLDP